MAGWGKRSSRGRGFQAGLDWEEDDDEEEPDVGWSPIDADPEVHLQWDHLREVYRGAGCPSTPSRSWIGVRGRPGISWGSYMFEIKVAGVEDLVRVGWSQAGSSRSVGSEVQSYGYGGTGKKSTGGKFAEYGPPFGQGDVVGCLLNRAQRFVAFTLNGEFLGKAFPIPASLDGEPLYPTVCAREAFMISGYFGHKQTRNAGLLIGYRGYWPVAMASEEDKAETQVPVQPLTKRLRSEEVAAPKPLSAAPKPANSDPPKVRSTIIHLPSERGRSPLSSRSKGSTAARALQGMSEDLERPYVRFTNLPRAVDIRPVRVLRQSFDLVKTRWAREKDWVWAGEMLRSIRQDLIVQMVRSPFAVEVYEFNARTALEEGDYKQFDQCSTHLEDLHRDAEVQASANEPEFLAYRLLYLALQADGGLALSAFLQRRGAVIRKAAQAGDPHLAPAWRLRAGIAVGRTPKAVSFGAEVSSSFKALFAVLVERGRLRQLVGICRGCKPAASLPLLQRTGLDKGPELACNGDEASSAWPLVLGPKDRTLVNCTATIAAAETRLTAKRGQRLRLGHASSDHAKGFVRAALVH